MSRPPKASARLFDRYLRGQARRCFTTVHWLREPGCDHGDAPALYVANHTNWWDGFLACLVTYRLQQRFHILMESRHLARYPVFRTLGALPIDRDNRRQAYRDLVAAGEWIRPGSSLWIFPQGERRPPTEPVESCERGAAQLILGHGGPVWLVPVGFRYAFLGEQLPEAFVLIGAACLVQSGAFAGRAPLMGEIERLLGATVGRLDALVGREQVAGFEPLVTGRLSVNKRLDRFRHAIGLLRGPFDARNG